MPNSAAQSLQTIKGRDVWLEIYSDLPKHFEKWYAQRGGGGVSQMHFMCLFSSFHPCSLKSLCTPLNLSLYHNWAVSLTIPLSYVAIFNIHPVYHRYGCTVIVHTLKTNRLTDRCWKTWFISLCVLFLSRNVKYLYLWYIIFTKKNPFSSSTVLLRQQSPANLFSQFIWETQKHCKVLGKSLCLEQKAKLPFNMVKKTKKTFLSFQLFFK